MQGKKLQNYRIEESVFEKTDTDSAQNISRKAYKKLTQTTLGIGCLLPHHSILIPPPPLISTIITLKKWPNIQFGQNLLVLGFANITKDTLALYVSLLIFSLSQTQNFRLLCSPAYSPHYQMHYAQFGCFSHHLIVSSFLSLKLDFSPHLCPL